MGRINEILERHLVSPVGFRNGLIEFGYRSTISWACSILLRKNLEFLFVIPVTLLDVVSIDQRALESRDDTEPFYFDGPERFRISYSRECGDFPNVGVDVSGDFRTSSPSVVQVPNVTLLGKYPLPLDEGNKIITPAVGKQKNTVLNVIGSGPSLLSHAVSKRPVKTEVESAVLLYNSWSQGYFHWVLDDLTRLQGIEEACSEGIVEDPKVIVGPEPPDWQLEYLDLLGFDPDEIIRYTDPTHVAKLIVPSTRRENQISPNALRWLRERLLDEVDRDSPVHDDRVYVSRADADRRQVINEDELMDELSDYGFSRYVLSDLTVREQIRLFSECEIIVSPHGANLTNLVFSSDPKVFELYSDYIGGHYAVISDLIGADHEFLRCEPVGPHMRVDTDKIIDRLEDGLSDRE